MPKPYKDRKMEADYAVEETDRRTPSRNVYFFPKANPPVTIEANSLKEAEEILAANKK